MRRLNLTIALGLVAALIGALLVFAYGSNVQDRIAEGKETVPVLVATGPIEGGATVEDITELTEVRDVPREYVAEGALRDLAAVQGLVLAGPISTDAQLTAVQFIAPRSVSSLTPEPGMLAVAVQVGLSPGVARYLSPGSTVDVFATYQTVSSSDSEQGKAASNRTKLFLGGIRVLSVSVAAGQADDGSGGSPPQNEVIAVLEVLPTQAERLVNASTLGSIYLALSNEGENHSTPNGVTPDDVVESNRKG